MKQLAFILKGKGVTIDDEELATGVLINLSKTFENLVVALDALGNDDENFTYELVKSRLIYEEKRSVMRDMFH